ncbi:GNAT family N-acetyltransferase [Aeoliella sp. SH292]|uniref:GNAT family N-acetyltransferase n=1 Tax=Aeoliella sp. SH292 TaxID=3454464 RepID=UPI003F9B5852
MPNVSTQSVVAANEKLGAEIDGHVFTGTGQEVVRAVAKQAGVDPLELLSAIVNSLLVPKGADWTAVILSEYMGLYPDSRGLFSLVWDDITRQLVAHGSVFQSASNPWTGLLAHIRTLEGFKGLGLGTLVTEQLTAAAFEHGAGVVVLATDDKIHRISQGERAAHSMYSRLGYAILGETRLADTIDWLMAISKPLLTAPRNASDAENVLATKGEFIATTRHQFAITTRELRTEPVTAGDLAGLFLLLNLCPKNDFRLKLTSWQIHYGPELERTYITLLRQAIVDQDRLQDASQVLRDRQGRLVAVCGAPLIAPFTRRTYAIDFYAVPEFVQKNPGEISRLVRSTLDRILESPLASRPCAVSFVGIDEAKIDVFQSLGFAPGGAATSYYDSSTGEAIRAREYVLHLQ